METQQIQDMDKHLDQIADEVPEESSNGEIQEADKKEQQRQRATAGQYVVLYLHEGGWREVEGTFDIKKGDPKRQAMADANNEDLQHLADGDEGIRLKTVPLSSWQNEAGYKYDRVLRELD